MRRQASSLAMLLLIGLLASCQVKPPAPLVTNTLDDIDRKSGQTSNAEIFVKPKSVEEIRKAYTEYLESAVVDEASRLNALTRLAELEYSDSGKLIDVEEPDDDPQSAENRLYRQRVERTVSLLETSLRDYPDAAGNDSLLYQLAKAQAQIDRYEDSMVSLTLLVEKYPKSSYYVESQFRVAENAFSVGDYSVAEYSYSEVILSLNNDIFYEKALFKRGWARFKQGFYSDAIDDFIQAVLIHEFGAYESLTAPEKEQFNEYFRAIALAFSYQNDTAELANYFKNRNDFRYTYHTYQMIGDLYLKQERFSDAVTTHQQFIGNFPESEDLPYAYLKIIEIWKKSGFRQQIYQAIDEFYLAYNPDSRYWLNQNENSKVNRVIRRSMREYLVLMAGYYHNRYQAGGKAADLGAADNWYQRYLKFYDAYARQDNIFYLYGELLNQNRQAKQALNYYEQAAFDNELILHQEAAYAAITTADRLYQVSSANQYLERIINYSRRFAREYPEDGRSAELALYAAQQAFRKQRYKATIELADLARVRQNNPEIAILRASAYYDLREFATAEQIYQELLEIPGISADNRRQYRDKLALSIYRQGESARDKNNLGRAIEDFARISTQLPKSEIAPTGLFDAIALQVQNQQWTGAIDSIKRFQALYPNHRLTAEVSKNLSAAYLKTDQGVAAAREFEKLAGLDADREIQAAALWQAAELYQEKEKYSNAIKAYQNYAQEFKKPYAQMLEAMHQVAALYARSDASKLSLEWYRKISQADQRALNNARTERSRFVTSNAYLQLARFEKNRFDALNLTLPLNRSLRSKKAAMQSSVKLFGQASLNKDFKITTEATYSIARIYQDFSEALLASDRPANLSEEELDQYEILLEDQAFPFEDKSIEFFEINLSRIKTGLYNEWIQRSHQALIHLFPLRYDRQPLLDDYIAYLPL